MVIKTTHTHTQTELREFETRPKKNSMTSSCHLVALVLSTHDKLSLVVSCFSITPGYHAPEVSALSTSIQFDIIHQGATLRAECFVNYSPCWLQKQ